MTLTADTAASRAATERTSASRVGGTVRPALDPQALRADFPQFERLIHGKRLAYLDSASTSLKPRRVLDAMDGYNRRYTANVHRGIYTTG